MQRQRGTKRVLRRIATFALLAVLILPIVVYVHTFGGRLSEIHGRWGEMGSAMSGIYGPILSLLGFGVLIMQVNLQSQTNKHMFEQAYVQDARADLEYYLTQLARILNISWPHDLMVVRDELQYGFKYASIEDLKGNSCIEKARNLNMRAPELFSIWIAICPILDGLSTYQGSSYELHFNSAMQKITAMITFDTAVALDNFVWCQSEGRLGKACQFSRNFRSNG